MKLGVCAMILLLAGCRARHLSCFEVITCEDGHRLDVSPCPNQAMGCAQDAACVLLSYWKMDQEPILSQIPSDRGVTIPELASIFRRSGMHAELGRDDRRLQVLKDSIDEGIPVLLVVEITAGPDVPVSPILRARGYPHFLVVTGYDVSRKRVFCLGLDTSTVALSYRRLASWWKRTDYAFLRVFPSEEVL